MKLTEFFPGLLQSERHADVSEDAQDSDDEAKAPFERRHSEKMDVARPGRMAEVIVIVPFIHET